MDFFSMFELTAIQWSLVIVAAFMVGLSKSGVNGVMMLVIPILANVFGGKESTGILLPLLVAGDIFAVGYYRKHANWNDIRKLLPWTLGGLAVGAVVGNYINDRQFKLLMASIIIICLGILIYIENRRDKTVPKSHLISVTAGMAAGFSTMIGNAAGPIFSVYLLARGFKKYDFMGTSAWFFLIINLTKVPLQVFVWRNVDASSFLTAALMLPAIALGAFLGSRIIRKFNEKFFRYFIIILTAISAVRLLV